jgi:hypothetical protein
LPLHLADLLDRTEHFGHVPAELTAVEDAVRTAISR